ncbi:MAG: aldehyde dehydrogenase family protein [Calditrichaeota bacterium]|nr:MAG: aldehyde dehydrogenase family protein [Calditrichota bacterium]
METPTLTAAHPSSGASESPNQDLQRLIDQTFEQQLSHFQKYGKTTAAQRIERLKRILNWVQAHRQDIREAVYQDLRKPPAEVDLSEIFVVTSEIKHAIRHLPRWMKSRSVRRTLPLLTTRAAVRYEPRGVVLIISPWNFPFNLTVGPLVSALAAGNCAVLKPSEFSPATSELIARMVAELFPPEEVAVFQGDREVAQALLAKPFHHIFFTGSSQVGKLVMKAAAEHLSSVTLELGGKSPVLVDRSANLRDAARKIVWGKFMNSGQTCIAPDYLLVEEGIYQPFVAELRRAIESTYGSSAEARLQCPDYSRIIHPAHWQRLHEALREAIETGAHVELGGQAQADSRYIEPTLISDVNPHTRLMEEEIFGPILPIIRYSRLDEAIRLINEKDRPLAVYIFSRDGKTIRRLMDETSSGAFCVNEVVLHFLHLNLPFGGTNASGYGNSHGFYGFKAFSHERAVLRHHALSPLKWLYPPYTPRVQKLVDLVLKFL